MNSSRKTARITTILLLLSFGGSFLFQSKIDKIRSARRLSEILYISSPKTIRRMSLGYDGLMADIYWTRAVQYFGFRHVLRTQSYSLLAPLLEITAALDPHLTVVYEYGSAFLSARPPEGAGLPEEAVKLVETGIKSNPNDWHLYYDLGFIYYLELKDYAKAADAFERGSTLPNAHPWLKILAARMAQHAGEEQTARMLWSATYQTSQDREVRANAAAHLRALDVDQTVSALESIIAQYRAIHNRLPFNFEELVSVGMLRAIPVDPMGHPYKLMPDGRVEVSSVEDLPFIQKGLPLGYVAPAKPNIVSSD